MAMELINNKSRREKRTIISLYQLNPSFYNKIVSRSSSASSSDQISRGGVPFIWEIQPGTPRIQPKSLLPPPPGWRFSSRKSPTTAPRLSSASSHSLRNLPGVSGRKRSFLAKRIKKFASGISDLVAGKLRKIPGRVPTRLTAGQKEMVRAFFWRNVNRAHRKLRIAGRKFRQVKARVSPGSPRGRGFREYFSRNAKFRPEISPSFSDFSGSGSGGSSSSSSSVKSPPRSRFALRSSPSLGKKLSTKWTKSLKLLRRGG
ncbi:unnamed protein product [Linum tenue]|uniref:Uncharacterized protein n=1 Tax=Linum tenue TaxID=586396 RepID=A0AAV0L1C9_9ROSI|nr:unnamed protein product [Linum tenue]